MDYKEPNMYWIKQLEGLYWFKYNEYKQEMSDYNADIEATKAVREFIANNKKIMEAGS